MVDKLGLRHSLFMFTSLLLVGQIVVATGITINSWTIILLGRFIFGLGGECFMVAYSSLLTRWFISHELAFAFGVNLAISKFYSVINNIVSPMLATSAGLPTAFWFGAILCFLSVIAVLATFPIDKLLDEDDSTSSNSEIVRPVVVDSAVSEIDKLSSLAECERSDFKSLCSTASVQHNSLWEHVAAEEVIEEASAIRSPCTLSMEPTSTSDNTCESILRDVGLLSTTFWLIALSCAMVYGCIIPFNNIVSALLLERDYFKETPSACALIHPDLCSSCEHTTVHCPSSKVQYLLSLFSCSDCMNLFSVSEMVVLWLHG